MSSRAPLRGTEVSESSSATVQGARHPDTEAQETTPDRGPSPSFADGYESVGGIPALVIKPSAEGVKFTCHAFSEDGSLLATGESNGTIKLWRTTNYVRTAEALGAFASPVESVAFLSGSDDQIIAVDTLGNTRCLTIVAGNLSNSEVGFLAIPSACHVREKMIERLSAADDPHYNVEILQQKTIRLSEAGKTAAVITISWAALDSRCYFTIWHEVYRYIQDYWKLQLSETYQFERDDIPFPEHFDMGPHLNLSKSGNSLIAFESVLPSKPVLYQRLGYGSCRKTVGGGESYAEWGRTEEFVLRWSLTGDNPHIAIHKTRNLADSWDESQEIAKMSLNPELLEVEAQMLGGTEAGRMEVCIFEVAKSGRKKILLWDATANAVKEEINMSLLRGRETTDGGQQPLDRDITFCVSGDGRWIGCLSKSSGTCALASVESGTIGWACDLPGNQLRATPLQTRRVMFSPSQRHFLVFTEFAIFAFAPAVLNLDVPARLQTTTLGDLFDEVVVSSVEELRFAQLALPSFAKISKLISPEGLLCVLRMAIPFSVLDKWFGLDGENSLAGISNRKLVDLSISGCGQFLAYIARQVDQTVRVKLCTLGPDGELSAHDLAHLRFPLRNEFGKMLFIPSKLFFYPAGSREGMLLISNESLPSVLFCDLTNESWKRLTLGIEECFTFRQTDDRKRICFLHVTGVCILDLVSQTVVDRVPYSVNFSQLKEEVDSYLGDESFESQLQYSSELLVSDDGRTVGFAWDSQNKQSLVITPSTEMKECREWLSDRNRNLQLQFSVSGDGRCTTRWSYDGTSNAFCVYSLPGNKSYLTRSAWSGNRGCYAHISADGSLFAVLSAVDGTFDGDYAKAVKLRKLGLYCTEQFCPDYRRLRQANPKKVAASVAKLVKDYGLTVLNGPLSPGMTIAQEIILNDDREALEAMKELLRDQEMELAFDWITEKQEVKNLLEEAIRSNSTNSVEHVVDLIKYRMVSQRKAAAALRKCWTELCNPRFKGILAKALSDNTFFQEACRLPGHDVSDPDSCCNEEADLWTERLNAIEQSFRKNTRELKQDNEGLTRNETKEVLTEVKVKLKKLEENIKETVQAAMREQEGRIAQTVQGAAQEQERRMTEWVERRLTENNAQMLRRIEESNQATQIRLDELLSLLRQNRLK